MMKEKANPYLIEEESKSDPVPQEASVEENDDIDNETLFNSADDVTNFFNQVGLALKKP